MGFKNHIRHKATVPATPQKPRGIKISHILKRYKKRKKLSRKKLYIFLKST